MMLPHDLTPEQRASLATAYRILADRVVWAGYDPRPVWILKAREMERGEAIHVYSGGTA